MYGSHAVREADGEGMGAWLGEDFERAKVFL